MKYSKYIPIFIPKGWGQEIIIANNDKYCGKILDFNPSGQGSLHFHAKKEETWYILSGEFTIELIDTETAKKYIVKLYQGDCFHVKPFVPHKITCYNTQGGKIMEISSTHFDEDSYRIAAGDSQK